MPVELIAAEEGGAYGAALLAGVGVGAWSTVESACETVVRVAKTVRPDPKTVSLMNLQYTEYCKLYPALKAIRYKF